MQEGAKGKFRKVQENLIVNCDKKRVLCKSREEEGCITDLEQLSMCGTGMGGHTLQGSQGRTGYQCCCGDDPGDSESR